MSSAAAPVLALHGFTGTGVDFDPVSDPGWSTPDLVGHGTAPAPPTVAPYAMAAEVARIGALFPPEPAVLLGYSMGGRLALALAVHRAEHDLPLAGLVLIGATAGIADAASRAERRRADAALADRIEAIGVESFLAEWATRPIIASQQRIEPGIRAGMAARRQIHRARGLANSLRGMGAGAMPSLWHRLNDIRCPTLVVTGADDVKFGAIARRMLERLPDAEGVVIEGAGHCAHLERPAVFRSALSAWRARRGR